MVVQAMRTLLTSAPPTVPLPFVTLHDCAGLVGCEKTVML